MLSGVVNERLTTAPASRPRFEGRRLRGRLREVSPRDAGLADQFWGRAAGDDQGL